MKRPVGLTSVGTMTAQGSLDIEHQHSDPTGGWLRPAVFGMMDGLVSNAALIAGVAGGTRGSDGTSTVLLAGFAGLAAGAFSMAAGEYASVASESEAAEREVETERAEILRNPEGERGELAVMLGEMGLDEPLAQDVSTAIHRDPETAVSVHSQLEFGITPGDLASPVVAALSSFVAFSIGAAVPLVPYLLGSVTVLLPLLLTLVALFACGAVVTRLTNRPWWFGGLRQVLLGMVAFVATYGIGAAIGTQV